MFKKIIKYFFFAFLVGVFWIPFTIKQFHLLKEEKLEGYFEIPDSSFILSDTSWLSGGYQKKYEKWYNYNMGLHLTGVRFANQLNYWMYEQAVNTVLARSEERRVGKECRL